MGLVTDAAGSADAGIMIESDDEHELDLRNIPQATGDDTLAQNNEKGIRRRQRKTKVEQPPTEEEAAGDEKKLSFSTHYESFNICGWVLCLLVTRKGGSVRMDPAASELNRQPLLEEFISTQAQASVGED